MKAEQHAADNQQITEEILKKSKYAQKQMKMKTQQHKTYEAL